ESSNIRLTVGLPESWDTACTGFELWTNSVLAVVDDYFRSFEGPVNSAARDNGTAHGAEISIQKSTQRLRLTIRRCTNPDKALHYIWKNLEQLMGEAELLLSNREGATTTLLTTETMQSSIRQTLYGVLSSFETPETAYQKSYGF